MSKHWIGFKQPCFEMFKEVTMKVVMERNTDETLRSQNLIIIRNFQYWPKFLAPNIKYVYFEVP